MASCFHSYHLTIDFPIVSLTRPPKLRSAVTTMFFKRASVPALASMLALAAALLFGILVDGARAASLSTRGRNEICHGDQGAKTEDLRCCTKSKWCYLSEFIEDSQERFFFEADDDGERMTQVKDCAQSKVTGSLVCVDSIKGTEARALSVSKGGEVKRAFRHGNKLIGRGHSRVFPRDSKIKSRST